MAYIDGMIGPVPVAAREAYQAHSARLAELLKRHGALELRENWGELLDEAGDQSLATRVHLRPGETVVFSWVVWPSRSARDQGWAAADAEYQEMMDAAPIDGERMFVAGFEPIGGM